MWELIHQFNRGEITFREVFFGWLKFRMDQNGTILSRLSDEQWNEHGLIGGTTGAGKGNIYELLLKKRLPRALRRGCSIVLIDGSVFPERVTRYLDLELGAIRNKNVYLIDPAPDADGKVDHIPAMNMFDVPSKFKGKMSADYLIGTYVDVCRTLLNQELSSLMETLFANAVQLMFCFDNPTLRTLRDVIQDPEPFLDEAHGLDPEVARFFRQSVLCQRSKYDQTRKDVTSRIETLLARPVIRKLLCSDEPRLNLFDAVDQGGVFIVATRQADMGDDGTRLLGRFVLNTIHRIAQARARSGAEGVQTFVMIDELADYVCDGEEAHIARLIKQARKYGVSIITAFQITTDFSKKMWDGLTLSNVQLFGRMGESSAKACAAAIRIEWKDLTEIKKGDFFCRVGGMHKKPIKITVPPGALGKYRNKREKKTMEREGHAATAKLRRLMARRYGEKPQAAEQAQGSNVIPMMDDMIQVGKI